MKKIQVKTEGLTGEALTFATRMNETLDNLSIVDREAVTKEIRASLGGLVGEDGKMAVDVSELQEFLGEGEKGIRTILKKQGDAIAQLKKSAPGETRDFRSILDSQMDQMEKIYNTREGSIKLNLRAPAVMTTDNTVTGHATLPDDLIESFSLGGFIEKRRPREYVFDIAARNTVANLTQYKTWLEEGNEEGAFAIVAEGGLKPLVSQDLVRNSVGYDKVAAKYVVTEEFAKFREEAYNIIKRLINQKILRDYAAILTTRLIADAAPYAASALDGEYAAAVVTDYHAIAAVAAQIEALEFMPDVLVMNPQDKWRIGMSQDTNGQFYLTIPITDPSGQTRMMGFTVRTSTRMPVGDFMLGESGLWNIEDESLTLRLGYGINVTKDGTQTNVIDVQSDVDHNRFRMIIETYFRSWIGTANAGSFVKATFATVKAAVTAGP